MCKFFFLLLFFLAVPIFANESVLATSSQNIVQNQLHFKNGKDYFSYLKPIEEAKRNDKKIQIQSFFAYDCQNCASTQDLMELYSQINANRVVVYKRPVATENAIFTPSVYYSLVSLGREDLANLYLFENTDKQIQHIHNKEFIHWLSAHGVTQEAFTSALNTPEIQDKIKNTIEMTQKYGVFTIPFVVINGEYVITQSTLYDNDYTFAVLDYLVDKVENECQNCQSQTK